MGNLHAFPHPKLHLFFFSHPRTHALHRTVVVRSSDRSMESRMHTDDDDVGAFYFRVPSEPDCSSRFPTEMPLRHAGPPAELLLGRMRGHARALTLFFSDQDQERRGRTWPGQWKGGDPRGPEDPVPLGLLVWLEISDLIFNWPACGRTRARRFGSGKPEAREREDRPQRES